MALATKTQFKQIRRALRTIQRTEGILTAHFADRITEVVQRDVQWWSISKQGLTAILNGTTKRVLLLTYHALTIYVNHMKRRGLYKP